MLQVVRKSHISAPLYLGFGVLRLALISLFVTDSMGAVCCECFINFSSGIVLAMVLIYYARRFDPDKVDANAEKRFDVLSGLNRRKKALSIRRMPGIRSSRRPPFPALDLEAWRPPSLASIPFHPG